MRGWFHAHSGWYFHRVDGWVHVRVQPDPEGPVEAFAAFSPETWASIAASVSALGESGETFQAALDLQRGSGATEPAAGAEVES